MSKIDVYVRGYGMRPKLMVSVRHMYNPALPIPYTQIDEEFDISKMRNDENWEFSFHYEGEKKRPYIAWMEHTDKNVACAIRLIEDYVLNRYFFNTVLMEIPMYISFFKEKPGFVDPLLIGEKLCRT